MRDNILLYGFVFVEVKFLSVNIFYFEKLP